MAEGINISMPEVASTAASVRGTNNSLNATLNTIKGTVNGLGSWQSDAGNTIRERMNAMAPKFQTYFDVVESYSKFLDATVQNYEATEAKINASASQFK